MALDQVDVEKIDESGNMSFIEHLEVLRWHIMRSIIGILIATILAFINGRFIFDNILLGPTKKSFWTYRQMCKLSDYLYADDRICMGDLSFSLQNLVITGQFFQHVFIALMSGLVIAFPYILFEFWRFIRPALASNERSKTTGIVFFSSLLFLTGVLFGYYVLAPISISFLGNYQISDLITNQFTLQSIVNFIATLVLGTGLIFQLPLLIYFLAKLGIVSSALLRKYRKHSIIVTLIIASIVTPPDIASQIILGIPIYLLYEMGIIMATRVEKAQAKTT